MTDTDGAIVDRMLGAPGSPQGAFLEGTAAHPAVLAYLARFAPSSRATMRGALEKLAELAGAPRDALAFPWHQLRPEHASALRAALAERFAPATANRHLAALRGVLREAWRCGLISAEARDLPPVRGERLPRGRALEAAELWQLFEACADGTPAGARDAAAFALLFGAGLRRAEAVGLDLDDVDIETGELRVLGKGDNQRVAYLPAGGRAALAEWLRHRGGADGPLLQPVNRGGAVTPRRMTAQSLRLLCQRRARQAGIPDFSPHDLRRSFVGAALDAGADISAVQRLAGHASPATTSRYDRRPERVKQRAAELVHVPFRQDQAGS